MRIRSARFGDALPTFPADEIVLAATQPDEMVARARERFPGVPVRAAQPLRRAA
jgi:hypothetical protein